LARRSTETELIRLAPSAPADAPLDDHVKLPRQVREAAALADDLVTGKRRLTDLAAKPTPRSPNGFPYTNVQINEVLKRLKEGKLQVDGPDFEIIRELAKEGAKHITARRRGARQPRENSDEVTRRLEVLVEAFKELPPRYQKTPTGRRTIERLRESVIQKLGLPNKDEAISEETVRSDIRQVRSLLRTVQRGLISSSGGRSEKTQREMEAGRANLAKIAAGSKADPASDLD
jgi:hypothetical protein